MKRLITILAILSLLLITACGNAPQTLESSGAINDSVLDDLGKTLGELAEKHGGVAKVTEPFDGKNLVYFNNTPVKFYFELYEKHSFIASFSDEDLSKTTSSLTATVADIFSDVKETVSAEKFAKMHNLNNISCKADEETELPYASLEYDRYSMSISTVEFCIINPEDTIVVKIDAPKTTNESSEPIEVSTAATPTINDSAFEDLGKTLGELIDKYRAVTKVDNYFHGIYFANTNVMFFFDLGQR